MKKIFIACSKHFYDYIPKIKQELELMGYEFISKCSRGRGKKSYYTIKQFDKEREEYISKHCSLE